MAAPDDFRRFVDRAHALRLGVILDVVYNHLGPDGNYLGKFAPQYFCEKTTDWGKAINFDGDDSGPGAGIRDRERAATGSTSSIWMDCGWTPRRTFTTAPKIIFCELWRVKFASMPLRAK